jgi:hypothetical protein
MTARTTKRLNTLEQRAGMVCPKCGHWMAPVDRKNPSNDLVEYATDEELHELETLLRRLHERQQTGVKP